MDPLSESFVRELHRPMSDRTWIWAGRYRLTDKNLGVAWYGIPSDVRILLDDGRHWLENGTYPIGEAALRLADDGGYTLLIDLFLAGRE
ncbi:MAG: fido (protein-threonine AMPylation protein) [Rhodothermales bacterium]|jgi:fido (protein-threonine AMPylation protein)